MADRTIKILAAAEETDLLTLDEAKGWLGIPLTDSSQDATLQDMISTFSEEIAERLNRHPTVTIGQEEVLETWRETMNGRLFLSHWPVKEEDIISVTVGDVTVNPLQLRQQTRYGPGDVIVSPRDVPMAVGEYELEEASGKISNISVGGAQSVGWSHPVTVHYKGGYLLPDECPLPLKRAVVLMIRQEKILMRQAETAGIRQISHKESRVSFFDPNAVLIRSLGAQSPTEKALSNLLTHYMRFEV